MLAACAIVSCTPMKSSPKEEKHQLELTLHELQTNLDDLRHDINCFQTELQILDGKIKNQEDINQKIKQQHLEKLQTKIESLNKFISSLETKAAALESKYTNSTNDISQLSLHANETSLALSQHKEKIKEIENAILSQSSQINEIAKVKSSLEDIVKIIKSDSGNYTLYKVKSRDSLEKIAKSNNVSVEALKKLNNLENDLIVIGQELKIPKQ